MPTYDEVEFQAVVASALKRGIDARTIADMFECAVSTVERWADGRARPTPRVMAFVVRELRATPKRST